MAWQSAIPAGAQGKRERHLSNPTLHPFNVAFPYGKAESADKALFVIASHSTEWRGDPPSPPGRKGSMNWFIQSRPTPFNVCFSYGKAGGTIAGIR